MLLKGIFRAYLRGYLMGCPRGYIELFVGLVRDFLGYLRGYLGQFNSLCKKGLHEAYIKDYLGLNHNPYVDL